MKFRILQSHNNEKKYREVFPTLNVINHLLKFYNKDNLLYNRYWNKTTFY